MFFSYITACEEVCKGSADLISKHRTFILTILQPNRLVYIGSIGSLNVVENI